MKKTIIWTAGTLMLAAGGLAGFVTLQESKTAKGTTLAGQDVSDLTADQLRDRLESWWQEKKNAQLAPVSKLLSEQPNAMTLTELGLHPDIELTLKEASFQGYADTLLGKEVPGGPVVVVWKQSGGDFAQLTEFVKSRAKPRQEASVTFSSGHFNRQHEVPSFALDTQNVGPAALQAMSKQKSKFELPMKTGEVAIDDEAVDRINLVVKSFTTRFSAGNLNRSHNIRLAAASLNGQVLLPGEVLSYNETVGRRTPKAGYKEAGVYANGKHEVDFGGGICQVSSTLFNAVALANLEIVSRSNHSMPVPYVPVGRDATVDYDRIDFKFKNNFDTPIAISSEVVGGSITFYVLGSRKMDTSVHMETSDHSSWGNKIQYVTDSSLPTGATKVIERGSSGRKCTTWRIVERDGVEIRREKMFDSIYRASPRIIARGSRPRPKVVSPKPTVPVAPSLPVSAPAEPIGGGDG